MTTWFTADHHFGHHNILSYTHRPYDDTEAMNRDLIRRWNDTVAPDDVVWVLGDFALGTIADTLPLAGALHGYKVLLAGNHDRCWAVRGATADAWTQRYLDAGFDEIRQGQSTMTIGDVTVLLCHFPYTGDSHDHDRFVDQRPVDAGGWLLHGHVHEGWAQRERMINVGVDVRDYRPISIAEVAALIAAGPA